MNERQKAFADYYIETNNATESAKRAGYSEKTAYSIGNRLLKNVEIETYIKERLESKEKDRVASQNEVLEFLTQVMRGEVEDQLGLETPVRERNKAAEMLGKRYGLWVDRFQAEENRLKLEKMQHELKQMRGDSAGDAHEQNKQYIDALNSQVSEVFADEVIDDGEA